MKKLLALLLLAAAAFAQQTVTSTTTVQQITASQQQVSVASTTGITVSPATALYIDRELLTVVGINGVVLTVSRGQGGTAASTHAAASTVLIGSPAWFYMQDPTGPCSTSTSVTPYINVKTGYQWTCQSSVWVWQQATVLASTYKTVGTGAGTVALKDSNDGNTVTLKGTVGTRGTSLILDMPATDPASTGGVPLWTVPGTGESTATWVNPVRQNGLNQTLSSITSSATCLSSVAITESSPLNAVGATYQYHAAGNFVSASGANVLGFTVSISTAANCGGSNTNLLTLTGGTNSNTSGSWSADGYIWATAIGASGAIASDMSGGYKTSATAWAWQTINTSASPVTLDTTVATYYLNFIMSWGGGTPTVTQRNWIVNRVN